MAYSILFKTDATVLCIILFIGCIVMVLLGRFVRNKFFHKDEQESRGGVNSLLSALFGLWAFMLAFTFGNSASRFDTVRTMIVDESSAIRNSIYRASTFPDSVAQELKPALQLYVQQRIDYYKYAANPDAFLKIKQGLDSNGLALWGHTVNASRLPNLGITGANMLAALTAMYDIAAKRDVLMLSGVPEPITYMLLFLALTISFVGGFTTPVIKAKEWIVITGFILLACFIIYLTLDMGRPLRGFIRPVAAEEKMLQLQNLF